MSPGPTFSGSLYDPLFGDPAVAARLSDEARVQAMLDVEAALAGAEAALGVIPAEAAPPIRAAARAALYDLRALADDAQHDGNLAIPLVRQLTRQVAATATEAARYVHWGATSQDIIDTALVLQLAAAVPLLIDQLRRAESAAAGLARAHADTVMSGRTWLQQATPVTFGLKAAGWVDALQRAHQRIGVALDDARVLQFGGASGTLAAFGARGLAVAARLAADLGLRAPALPWHAHRDRLVQLACTLGVATGTLGKIARDIALLGQTEIAEAREAPAAGRGGSSAMPHKQNPVSAAVALAAAVRAPGLVATMLTAMPQEHERGLGGWQAEWTTLPELIGVTAGAARAVADALSGLVVDPARMRANLDASHGLALSEAVAVALGAHVGKAQAHAIIEAAAAEAIASGRPFHDVLASDAAVAAHFDRAAIARLLDPAHYLGSTSALIERVLSLGRKDDPEDV
jgi:3-carboxy-cis,cis-muconate cycloisomerase